MSIVKVFTTQTCPNCFILKDWLKELGVEYDEIDAHGVPGIRYVPVTQIGNDGPFVGVDRINIKKALEDNKLI